MDDLIAEFVTETAESLEVVDVELVKFESNPTERGTLDNIFRLVHTVKGTCGFLGLTRLEAVAHAGETLLGRFRDGKLAVTPEAVTLVLRSIDRIKIILNGLEDAGVEPAGDDRDIIALLEAMAEGHAVVIETAPKAAAEPKAEAKAAPKAEAKKAKLEDKVDLKTGIDISGLDAALKSANQKLQDGPQDEPEAPPMLKTGDFDPVLGRALRPGEVSMDELEAAFAAAEAPNWMEEEPAPAPAPAPVAVKAPEKAPAAAAPAPGAPMLMDFLDDGPRDTNAASQSIRVSVDVLEGLMTLVSELVLTRNQLLQISRRREDSAFATPLQRLSTITGELQDSVMKTRMQPIGAAWKKLPRLVRDLSQELKKKIDLVMEGETTELDRQVLEMIKDPLTHMVRNSCDHGLESNEDRAAIGKNPTGKITLSAFHEGGYIVIRIADDGRGLNTARIREKIIEKNLATRAEVETMSDSQVHRYIFAPGFSTAAAVTNLSGRGVGMDVVRTNIEQIGGQIDLHSVAGAGSTFTIKIPLTLAIVSALIVGASGQRFAVPQTTVMELVRAGRNAEHKIERIEDALVLRLRDKLLPLVELAPALKLGDAKWDADQAFVMIVQVADRVFGLVVDDVLDTEEIVVKPLAGILRDLPMFSGATILGDGSVVLIMDPNSLAERAGTIVEDVKAAVDAGTGAEVDAAMQRRAMLLFRAGEGAIKAVELDRITRLEHVDAAAIERLDNRNALQYRGRLMPILQVEGCWSQRSEGVQPLLVFSGEGYSMGLAVDEIVDVVEDKLDIELSPDRLGVLGTAVVAGRASDILDVDHYLVRAVAEHAKRPAGKSGRAAA